MAQPTVRLHHYCALLLPALEIGGKQSIAKEEEIK